jgi:hypothetical protein
MKKSILELKGVQVLTKNEKKVIMAGDPSWGGGRGFVCGILDFPPCYEN